MAVRFASSPLLLLLGVAACSKPDKLVEGALPSASGAPAALVPPQGMLLVPAATFTMGDDQDATNKHGKPAHAVRITQPFFIDQLEVTAGEYQRCVASGKCSPAGVHGPGVTPEEVSKYGPMCNAQYPDRQNHPINCVDLGQAADYCAFVGKRLPTEAEWELAARGPEGRKFPWGNDPTACGKAVVSGCTRIPADGRAGTLPVGSFPETKSPVGALDMAGNVWEWVYDGFVPYSAGTAEDPAAPSLGELGVIRGGSWDFAPSRLTTAFRQTYRRHTGQVSTGFRCAAGGVPRPAPEFSRAPLNQPLAAAAAATATPEAAAPPVASELKRIGISNTVAGLAAVGAGRGSLLRALGEVGAHPSTLADLLNSDALVTAFFKRPDVVAKTQNASDFEQLLSYALTSPAAEALLSSPETANTLATSKFMQALEKSPGYIALRDRPDTLRRMARDNPALERVLANPNFRDALRRSHIRQMF